MMRGAVINFGLRPADFWALTVCEYIALNTAAGKSSVITTDDLQALMSKFPDR